MTVSEAKKMIKNEASRLGLTYGKITGITYSFGACVTLHDFIPHPTNAKILTDFARTNKIILSIYVNGISG